MKTKSFVRYVFPSAFLLRVILLAIFILATLSSGLNRAEANSRIFSVNELSDCPPADRFHGRLGLFAKNLSTGQTLVVNPDEVFAAASTIKVPVSVAVYRHFYPQADLVTRRVYDNAIELMLAISENDYFADLLDEMEESIGPETVRQHFAKLGMHNTRIRDPLAREAYGYSNVTSARDMAIFFEQLYLGRLASPDKTAFMLNAMANSIFVEELPRYMQTRRVIHKIGELDDVLADVGVVEGKRGAVLISIFTETPLETEYASDQIAAIAACLYERLTGESTAWNAP